MDSFEEKLKKAFKKKHPEMNVVVKDGEMLFDLNGNVGTINLESVKIAAKRNEEFVINSLVNAISETTSMAKQLENWEQVKTRIVPIPKHVDYGTRVNEKARPAMRTIAGELGLGFAIGLKDKRIFVTDHALKSWNKTLIEVEEQSIKNLDCSNAKWGYRGSDMKNRGFIMVKSKDEQIPCSSLIAYPKKLRGLLNDNGYAGQDVLIAIPFQDAILIAKAGPQEFLEMGVLGMIAQKDTKMPHPVSATPLLMDKNGVITEYNSEQLPEGLALIAAIDKLTGKTEMLGSMRTHKTEKDESDTSYIG